MTIIGLEEVFIGVLFLFCSTIVAMVTGEIIHSSKTNTDVAINLMLSISICSLICTVLTPNRQINGWVNRYIFSFFTSAMVYSASLLMVFVSKQVTPGFHAQENGTNYNQGDIIVLQ